MRKGLVTTNPLYWMPISLDQWLNEIGGGLRPEQKGALMDLLATAWKQDPPCTLPDDAVYLAARSGLGSRWSKLAPAILRQFVPVHGGRLQCPWLLAVYKAQLEKYENRRRANTENRGRREQSEMFDDVATRSGTKRRTKRGTIAGTIRTANAPQNKELDGGSVPSGQTDPPPPAAPAPEGARVGGGPTRLTDILRAAGVPR